MPMYDFVCTECNNKTEELCKHEDVIICDDCGNKMIKQMGSATFKNSNEALKKHKNKYGSETHHVPKGRGNGVKFDIQKKQ